MLTVPHHGGDTSLTEPLLEAVSPEVAIVSVGSDNRFGHPSEVTLEKLEGIATYQTVQDGSIDVISDGSVYWLRTDESGRTPPPSAAASSWLSFPAPVKPAPR